MPPSPSATSGRPVRSGVTDAELKANVDRIVAASPRGSGSLSIGVVVRGLDGTLRHRFFNYGTIARGATEPVTERTIYVINSVTKVFTGIALADLAQRGVVQLTDPAQKYLTGVTLPAYEGTEITLLHLATHSAALPGDPPPDQPRGGFAAGWPGVNAATPLPQVFSFLSAHKLPRAPGTQYEYSNAGHALLGYIEERATGKGLDEIFRERISAPLGLTDTTIVPAGEQLSRVAAGYETDGRPASPSPQAGWGLGSGSLRSTAADMAAFLAANMDVPDTALGAAMRTAQRDVIPRSAPGTGSGLGWESAVERGGQRTLSKGGRGYGFGSDIWLQDGGAFGVVVLASEQGGGGPVSRALRGYLGSLRAP